MTMRDNRFDIHQWQAEYLREAEGGGGDEKLEKLIGDLNNTAMNLTAVFGQLPNYQEYIMKPDNPDNDAEHNKINVAVAKDALHDSQQYLDNLIAIMKLLKGHIKEKYNFVVDSKEVSSKNGEKNED